MALLDDQVYWWKGRLYVPCHTAPLAGGPFLPATLDAIEEHLELPATSFRVGLDRYVGDIRLPRRGLAAARIHGDSMIGLSIFDGDIVIFQRQEFDYLENGEIVVIEKVAEEEGFGAWALKKFIIKCSPSYRRNEFQDTINWDDPVIKLRSSNPRIRASELDPSGEYRVRGRFLRAVPRHEATFIESPLIRRIVMGKK